MKKQPVIVEQGAVLALDIATTTGWAWHRPGMPRPFFGHMKAKGKAHTVGQSMHDLLLFLRKLQTLLLADGTPITHFFYEMPFIDTKKINATTSKRLMALAGACEMFAFQVGAIGCYEIQISEWRKHFLGRGGGFKKIKGTKKYLPGEDPKELAVRRCAQYGWHTAVHDEADACGVLDYALTMIPGYVRPWRDDALLGDML